MKSEDGKRTISVSIRVSERDMELMTKAANKLWPRAVLNRSSIVLGLARMAAEDALKKNGRKG